jgi:hypothetical protein
MSRMSNLEESITGPEEFRRTRLEEKLREVDQQLRSEMRARGFDPDQDDNVALTAPLARLYSEREQLREELESLSGK